MDTSPYRRGTGKTVVGVVGPPPPPLPTRSPPPSPGRRRARGRSASAHAETYKSIYDSNFFHCDSFPHFLRSHLRHYSFMVNIFLSRIVTGSPYLDGGLSMRVESYRPGMSSFRSWVWSS